MGRDSNQTVVFLHGIGAGPESWGAQVAALPDGFDGVAPPIRGLDGASVEGGGSPFALPASAAAIRDELDRRGIAAAHVCGLSLGAMVAVRLAVDFPDRVRSLVLSGGQVHPSTRLIMLQTMLMRVLPTRMVAPPGTPKQALIAVMRTLAAIDLTPDLPRIGVPTLVMCGSKDRPNLPAARELAAGIPGAELQIVPGAVHGWNTQMPDEFAQRLNAFLLRVDHRIAE